MARRMSDEYSLILKVLRRLSPDGATSREIANRLGIRGMNSRMSYLRKAGFIEISGTSNRSPVYSITTKGLDKLCDEAYYERQVMRITGVRK